ncbi:hypothetical protein [Streptomyces sp. NPDC059816]|uniref:hypothetical protein n=1 Tax=Streptomyces sp. NPDC059816 TaxID=3346960 RepID=UPI00364E0FD9
MPDDTPPTPDPSEHRPGGTPPELTTGQQTDLTPAASDEPPEPGTCRRSGWQRFLPLRDGAFTSTFIVAPVVVLVIGLGIVGAFSWIGKQFEEGKPPLYVSGSHSPKSVVTTPPGASPPSPSRAASPAPGARSSAAEGARAGQSEAGEEGIQYLRDVYLCPWEAWVVNRAPGDFGTVPAREDGSPDPEVINNETAGDPGRTRFTIDVQPVDDRPLQIKELRIKVLERKAAPAADAATLVGLQAGGCGQNPTTLEARANLDGGADFATVRFEGKGLPQELVEGKVLSIGITVETRTCDCRWVPEIVWAKDGEVKETEFRIDGKDFRTIATDGLQRRAWKQDLNTRAWTKTVFNESILGRREP